MPVDLSAPGRQRSDSFPSQDIRSRSRSPQTSQVTLLPPSTGLPPAIVSASSVAALELQVEQRFCQLEQRLNGQFSELLASIHASQAPTVAAQPAPHPPPGSVRPQPPSHLTGFDPAASQTIAPAGESPPLSVSRSFAWVPVEVVLLVERDQLKPEHLVKLRNPESRVSREASRSTGLTLTDGQLSVVDDSSESRTSAFVKAIPSIAALAQVWLVYVAIRARHTANLELNAALLAHLEQLIEFDHLYSWRAVADYHLAVCRQRFGTATISEWASYDPQVAGRVLFPYQKSAHNPSRQETNLGSGPSQPPQRSSRPRQRPIAGTASEIGVTTAVKRVSSAVLDTLNVDPRACTAFECATAGNAVKCAFPRVPNTRNVATMACTAPKCATASTAVKCAQGFGVTHDNPSPPRSTSPPRPNTFCELPIFDEADSPASEGSLQLRIWSRFLAPYPDQAFADQLRGALRHGAKLDYEGPLRSATRLDVPNLPLDDLDVAHLRQEITARLREGRLRDKRRTIYHLSHPRQPGSRLPSVNSGIQPSYVAIHYDNLVTIMDFIGEHPGASLWKADLEDAFRHVIVAESDARLMGIHFDGVYYQECALAFGARSSPFIFNLFAEFLHWLLAFALRSVTACSPLSHSGISHYLDDFYGASDATADPATPVQLLSLTAAALGFKISAKKTWWAATRLEILGIELDTVAQTASIIPQRRSRILQLCLHIVARGRASLLELQQVAGHLQFVTRVAPHGPAFLRRIYDAVRAHFKAPFGRRISKNTRAELLWWVATLTSWDGVSLLQPSPLLVEHIWTDASKHSIGAHLGCMDSPSAAFSHELPRRHRRKDIRFLEALAVLEALPRFSPLWTGHRRIVIHVDNENVEYGLRRGSIRDPQTQVLFREIFALSTLPRCIIPTPVQHCSVPSAFVAASGLSHRAASLPWSGLAHTTRDRSATVYSNFGTFAASLGITNPLPASTTTLIEWVANLHASNKSLNTVKRDLYVLKSWHIDLGLPTEAFDSPRLERVVRGFKRVVGDPLPVAKLPITLPLLRQLIRTLPTVCPSQHDRHMFRAAFCLAFACLLRAGELTWVAPGPNTLTVSSVTFAVDHSHAIIALPASKTDPFRQGATLLVPAVPLSTCAVASLRLICRHRAPQEPLFVLEGGRPFSRGSFLTMLRLCLGPCGVAPSSYSGHSFRRGAATWAVANGADADTIRALGRWRSDCFRRYADRSTTERAATSRAALYSNTSAVLCLDTPARRDL
ncbi:hypothetical protein NDA18_005031 [Ustilago nuda]|nr:hypothetical protein NDA18_005031 [Ustilago nuda]